MKPQLLFYCQHSLGIGHLTRSFALAAAFAQRFHVVFLNGGPLPPGTHVPPGVDIIHLPPLGMDDGHSVVSRDASIGVDAARAQRRELILDAVRVHRPALVLVELFPFGRKKFAAEILAMIRAARAAAPGVSLVCSLRDILVSDRKDQAHHDERARWLVNRYFDAILVHADPAFARLEDTFRPRKPLAVPIHYTGFVVPARPPGAVRPRGHHVLVSAGGGMVGFPLFAAALEAHSVLWQRHRMPMRIVTGPFLPDDARAALRAAAWGHEGVEIVAHVPDLVAEMRCAAVSVSQCGYNTALDVLVSGVPALVVPYATKGENEQTLRARRLAGLGSLRMLAPEHLESMRLAAEIEGLLDFVPASAGIGMNGAQISTQRLSELCRAGATRRAPALLEAIS